MANKIKLISQGSLGKVACSATGPSSRDGKAIAAAMINAIRPSQRRGRDAWGLLLSARMSGSKFEIASRTELTMRPVSTPT